jgi:WD40 repeat protein/serine/threonine protein kinase
MQHSSRDPHEIFENALRIYGSDQRREFIERACAEDAKLMSKVESLLQKHEQDTSSTEQVSTPEQTQIMESSAEAPGTVIGPYKLRERLGEGGMGVVYLAEQKEPIRRKLALKIIKPGMDSRNVITRFEAERQALAMMSHPNIARILDGGTTAQGRPYFAMELVRGVPINDYCDQHQLTIRERLKLFIPVCHAVQHAHMKGIIHRDLKPSNILVERHGDEAVPKIIDFGIAKALDQELTQQTIYTQFAQLIGTPEYMSPEQARLSDIDIDTRSDIYSLGVMLYELLTGTLPYETSSDSRIGFADIRRIISEDEPRRPSQKLSTLDNQAISTVSHLRRSDPKQLAISMRRELDWVALKAIEKDRSRRYQTATALAQDLQRYLNHEPVQACPPSFTYRLRKLLYQNRTFVIASTIVVMSALAGTAVSIRYASQAQQARQHAEELLYASDIGRASEYWKQGDYRSFSEVLNRYGGTTSGAHDFRGFEWWYLKHLATVPSHRIASRDEQGCLVHYSANGRYLVLGWTDGRIDVKDARTLEILMSLGKHGDFVNGCDFHPTKEILATIADDGTARLWDLNRREEILKIDASEGHGHRVFFSADGNTLVTSGEDSSVYFWETSTGKKIDEIGGFSKFAHSGVEERMACPPSRKWLAVADGEGAGAIYDFQTRKKLIDLEGLNEHDSVRCLRFSQDGKYLAGGKKSRDVFVWRTDNGKQIARFEGHLDDIQDLAFHPAGGWLVTCDRAGVIRRWEIQKPNEAAPPKSHQWFHLPEAFRGHNDRIWSLDFAPDGSALVTGSRDNSFKLWTGEDDRSHLALPVESPVKAFFVNGGDELLVAEENQLEIWNRASGEHRVAAETSGNIVQLCVNESNRLAGTMDEDGWIQLWNFDTGELESEFEAAGEGNHCLSLSADARTLISSSYLSSLVSIWQLDAARQPRSLETIGGADKEDEERYDRAWLAPDNRSLVMHRLNNLHICDVRSGETDRICRNHLNRVSIVRFSKDGKLMASGSDDRTACIWDFATGELLHRISAHKKEVIALAFSPDGRTLVSGDEDGVLVFSQVNTGRVLFETQFQKNKILDLEFSPDGQSLAVVQPESLILLSGARE